MVVYGKNFIMMSENAISIEIKTSYYSPQFSVRIENKSLEVNFRDNLTTCIRLR